MRISSLSKEIAFFQRGSRFEPLKQARPRLSTKLPYSYQVSGMRGFTLLEMMIAMVILMVGLLGMLTTINVAIQQSTDDQLREIAVGIGEDRIRDLARLPMNSLLTFPAETSRVTKPFRGYSAGFNVTRTTSALGSSSAEIKVIVSWVQKGMNHQHELRTIRSQ